MRDSLRRLTRDTCMLLLGLSSLLHSGCGMLNPNSRFNVNRGEYNDEWTGPGVERQAANSGLDHEDADGIDKWWYSPKYRAINRNLGLD